MRLAIGFAVFGLVLAGVPALAGPKGQVGTWLTEDGRAKVRVEPCADAADKLCGFVVWMKDPLNEKGQPRTDIHNPDAAKRNRPSLGLELMHDLKPDDDGAFAGEVYNADNGKMYAVTLVSEKPDALHVKGCMMRFLCGSQDWTRVADLPVPGATKVVSSTTTKPKSPAHHDGAPGPTPAAGGD